MIRPTPWERLDGVKHTLEAILELTVQWEQQRIIKLIENNFERFDLSNNQVDGMGCEEFIALIKANS